MSLLQMGNLESSIYASLLAKKRLEKENGYWVDALTKENFGSYLWLLDRSLLTSELLLKAEEYAKDALDWILKRGLAKQILIKAQKAQVNRLLLEILIDSAEVTIEVPA